MAFSPEELQIIEWSKKNGKSVQEMKDAVFRFRSTGSPVDPTKQTPQRSTGADVAIGFAKGVGDSLKFASDVGQGAARALTRPIIGDAANQTEQQKSFSEGIDTALKASNTPQMVGKGLEFAAEFASPFVISRLGSLAVRAPSITTKIPVTGAKELVEKGIGAVKEFVQNPKLAFAKKNVSPQLETSAERLFLEGTERLKDPLATYDTYVNQAKKAITDIKTDPPISVVGESIGDAFNKVIASRRNVGKIMSSELEKIGDTRVSLLENSYNFFTKKLQESGLSFSRGTLKPTQAETKFADADVKLLQEYASQLSRLGGNPTVREIDAFLARTTDNLNLYKSSNGITGTTNAERLIKGSLSELREQFNPAKNPSFAPYYEARKQYANLSDFIDDGVGFLGKITQSGDFARDASLAKSSVQSILNNGKKDWLEKLEQLTGYQALDDSVLALQAMKDAGDFRGLSLLDELSKGAPTAAGFTQKTIDYAMQKVGRAVGGTPEEQTRAFLQALKEGAAKEGGTNAAFGDDIVAGLVKAFEEGL